MGRRARQDLGISHAPKKNSRPREDLTHSSATADATIESDANSDELDGPAPSELATGSTLGRYTILQRLGAGAMGVVYSAYDPDLDRRVAIKILHPRSRAAVAGGEEGKLRLLREAKALARLSHPNVVAIHDVGTIGSRVFLAMEFVDGLTVGAWMKAATRGWREVLTIFRAAGEGLAAAHGAGLVHRDFKPENMSIGADGRVRVLDFGLARAAASDGEYPDTAASEGAADHSASIDAGITSTGVLVGTPAYMSPEQHIGRAADARSDQFAFCITLYQALYGERPFAGDNVTALQASVIQNKVRPARAGSNVPKWLRKAVLKGLAVDPEARYPSMTALLTRLRRDPARMLQRRSALIATTTLLIGVGVGGTALSRFSDSPCVVEREAIREHWNPRIADDMRAKFVATGLPFAAQTSESATKLLDEYADAWVGMRNDSCAATHIQRTQSSDLYDLRLSCLERRRTEFDALLRILESPSGVVVSNALDAIGDLAPIAACADTVALHEVNPAPRDPAIQARIQAVQRMLADARAHDLTGQPTIAGQFADEALAAAESIAYAPLLADALIASATFRDHDGEHDQAIAALARAAREAAGAAYDEGVATAWIEAMHSAVIYEPGGAAASNFALPADVALLRANASGADKNPLLRARLDLGVASALQRAGRLDEAKVRADDALERFRGNLGDDHPQTIRARTVIGLIHLDAGEYSEARSLLERALADARSLSGDNPRVAAILTNLAEVARRSGDLEGALAQAREAVKIRLRADRLNLPHSLQELASIEEERGLYDEASEHYGQALEIYDLDSRNNVSMRGELLNNLAFLDKERGDLAAARDHLAQAYAVVGSLDTETAFLAKIAGNYAEILIRIGERSEGIVYLDRATRILRELRGQGVELAEILLDCSKALIESGDPIAARRHLEDALALVVVHEGASPELRASTRFTLAQALTAGPRVEPRDRDRAHELADAALADLRGSEASELRELRAVIEAWRAAH